MWPFNSWLIDHAKDAASRQQGRATRLREELRQAEQRKANAEAALNEALAAAARLDHYDLMIGEDFQCPDCWVENGVHATLLPIDSDTADDRFRCKVCHREYP